MKKYAMILLNKVINIIESETIPSYPPDHYGNLVDAVECDDTVTLGMIYNNDTDTFSQYLPIIVPEQLTNVEIVQAQILLNQQSIIVAQQSQEVRDQQHDEVLAAILLAQQTI